MSAHIKQLEKEKEEMDSKLKTESESRRDLEGTQHSVVMGILTDIVNFW